MTKAADYGTRFAAGFLRAMIGFYRYTFAYLFGGQCRFTPSCSAYALEAIECHGAFKGAQLAAIRLCRCHPWGGHGFDPVRTPSASNTAVGIQTDT